ncbi:MAG: 8-oxo-dGTP diphosphatase [Patescibacteria group bacterium]
MKKQLTLTMIRKEGKILLGLKKRGFGVGRWNGFGGKVEKGETIEEAVVRELHEESGVIARELEKIGVLEFEFENSPEILEVHIFNITSFNNEPTETEEMMPKWFNIEEIPFDLMWPDDEHWVPYFLEDKKFIGKFLFDKPSSDGHQSNILSFNLKEVDNL